MTYTVFIISFIVAFALCFAYLSKQWVPVKMGAFISVCAAVGFILILNSFFHFVFTTLIRVL